MNNMNSFSLRVLSLPDYNSPLFAHILDSDYSTNNQSLKSITKAISLSTNTSIVTEERWFRVARVANDILENEDLWKRLSQRNPYRIPELNSTWNRYRKELRTLLNRIENDLTTLSYQAVMNSVYQSSEGIALPLDYNISLPGLNWFNETLFSHLAFKLDRDRKEGIKKDDLIAWIRVLNLLLNKPTPRFKEQFRAILDYEIPFGLSPKTRSETLEALIKNSKTIALVPMLAGINSISTALSNGEWLIALKAASTTGAVVLVLISTISLSDRIVNWFKTARDSESEDNQ